MVRYIVCYNVTDATVMVVCTKLQRMNQWWVVSHGWDSGLWERYQNNIISWNVMVNLLWSFSTCVLLSILLAVFVFVFSAGSILTLGGMQFLNNLRVPNTTK